MPLINKAFQSLKPEMQVIVKDILTSLESKGYKPFVAEGLRTLEQQKEKVRLGYSTTLKSYHLSGLAADIVDSRYMWNINYAHRYWLDLGDTVLNYKPKNGVLIWGGIWRHPERLTLVKKAVANKNPKLITWFFDGAHVELHL